MKYCHQVLNTMKKRKAPNGAFLFIDQMGTVI